MNTTPIIIGSRHAPPKAGAMVEALRGLGYSTATALADVIDNSISARADRVEIVFSWRGLASTISVLDNGQGMTDAELDLAMRLGDRNPLDQRSTHDLGRFGLGLKTASFSQCRRLTVASMKENTCSCLRWDLDVLASSQDDGWYLLEGCAEGSEEKLLSIQRQKNGTLVLWENLDRVVTSGFRDQNYLDLIDKVEAHLATVFHRFLAGENPRLSLTLNGRPVKPWDPFLADNWATWSSPTDHVEADGAVATIQCHVLPHKDKLSTVEYNSAAGPDGWTAQQGFYVYRNERLLLQGSWLGLGRGRSWTKEEAHRLARIRLDIPNTADAQWKIDVRKATARPPVALRERLTRLAEDTRERARRVFAHRGQTMRTGKGNTLVQAWRTEHFTGGIRYRIDPTHPAVKMVLEEAVELAPLIKTMLKVIEETVPVQRIWLDTAEAKETPRTGFAGEPREEIMAVMLVVYKNMVLRKGLSPAEARGRLLQTEPFNGHADLIATLPDVISDTQRETDDF